MRKYIDEMYPSPKIIYVSYVLLCYVIHYHSVLAVVHGSLDLYCDFETSCIGWRNGTELDEKIGFNLARTVVTDPWHSIPWPFQGAYFAYVLGNGDKTPQVAWLSTDTIPCLLSSGYLTMYYWKNSFLSGLFSGGLPLFNVGIRQPPYSPNIRVLSTITGNNQWGWRFAVVEIPPTNESFQIVIEAVVQGKLDVVGVDDVVFHGYVNEHDCGAVSSQTVSPFSQQSSKPSDFEKTFFPNEIDAKKQQENEFQSLLSSVQQQQNFHKEPRQDLAPSQNPTSRNGFAQDFDNLNLPSGLNNLLFQTVVKDKSQFFPPPKKPVTEENPFFSQPKSPFVQEELSPSDKEQLDLDQQFSLSPFGLNKNNQRSVSSGSSLTPQNRIRGESVIRPKTTTTVEPLLTTDPPRSKIRVETPASVFKQVVSGNCSAVNCGFEGDSCSYEGTDSRTGAWIIAQGRMGNPLTGVTGPAFGVHYAVAYTVNDTSTQILRGAPFTTTEKTYLTFWYYFASARSGRLVVCDNSLQTCMWEKTTTSINPESRKWQQTTIQLKPGRHQLYFVVEELKTNYYAALDQILLRKSPTGQYAECSSEPSR